MLPWWYKNGFGAAFWLYWYIYSSAKETQNEFANISWGRDAPSKYAKTHLRTSVLPKWANRGLSQLPVRFWILKIGQLLREIGRKISRKVKFSLWTSFHHGICVPLPLELRACLGPLANGPDLGSCKFCKMVMWMTDSSGQIEYKMRIQKLH